MYIIILAKRSASIILPRTISYRKSKEVILSVLYIEISFQILWVIPHISCPPDNIQMSWSENILEIFFVYSQLCLPGQQCVGSKSMNQTPSATLLAQKNRVCMVWLFLKFFEFRKMNPTSFFFLLNLTSYLTTQRLISSGVGLRLNGFEEVCGPEEV